MKKGLDKNASRENRISREEAHEDLNDFKATKKSINELLAYRRALLAADVDDPEKIQRIRSKAIDAVNNLFDEGARAGES